MKEETLRLLGRLSRLKGYYDTRASRHESRRQQYAVLHRDGEESVVSLYPRGGRPLQLAKGDGMVKSLYPIDVHCPCVRQGDVPEMLRVVNAKMRAANQDTFFTHYIDLRGDKIVSL